MVLEPTPEFLGWVKSIPGNAFDITYDDFKEQGSVYLLPDELRNPEPLLRRNYKTMLKQELFSWYRDDSLWPPNLDHKTFKRFFTPRFHAIVIDLCEGDLQSECW